jgi:broad specificity polyphosphatase/5'/3'-nucleotidase SurE
MPLHSQVYAEAATIITKRVLDSGPPYLPENTFLNINFPKVDEENCYNVSDWKYALTRLHRVWAWTSKDFFTCDEPRLHIDEDVVARHKGQHDCWASISVAKAYHPSHTAEAEEQEDVWNLLGDLLTCVPHD